MVLEILLPLGERAHMVSQLLMVFFKDNMDKLILTIFIIVIACPAQAYQFAEGWNWEDSVLEGIFTAEVVVDLNQTLYISEHPNQYYEAVNPLLPRHPTKDQVWGACIIGAGVHALVSMALPKKYRTWWQGATIVLEGVNITRNNKIGIGWGF